MARFRVGTTFLGRYVLLGPVGHGGVSVVYRAWDTVRGCDVAIKMLDPALAGDVRAGERVRREAVITDRMRHPSVPQIFDHGDAPLGDGTSVSYVVMELLVGDMLAARLAGGALPWPAAVQIVAAVADVVAVAHLRGVVHRDLTAANIMLSTAGVKVIDFGVAATAEFAGPVEPADDVYALGVLLYQLVTGQSPYPTYDVAPPVAAAMVRWVAPTPVLAVPGLPRALAELCRRCMAKTPSARPDAARVAVDLWSLIGGEAAQAAGPLELTDVADNDPRRAGRHRRRGARKGPFLTIAV